MKSFVLSIIVLSLAGSFNSSSAQKILNLKDAIDLNAEARMSTFAKATPVNPESGSTYLPDLSFTGPYSPIQLKYAAILKRTVESFQNMALYSFIDEWYGTRYRFGGTSKKGVDCSSLTGQLLKSVYSIQLPRTAREQYRVCTKIQGDQMTEGDLVFFNTRGGVSHVGLFLGDGYFVHASSSSGVTINNLEENYYKSRFIGAGRINPIDYSRILL